MDTTSAPAPLALVAGPRPLALNAGPRPLALESGPRFATREEWLQAFLDEVAPWFDLPIPAVRISVGFTSSGARSNVIGECWAPQCDPDGACHIFLHPGLKDSQAIAATLLHELTHASVGIPAGHGPLFKAQAVKLGLEGKMTATVAGAALKVRVADVLRRIGPIPHGVLRIGGGSGQPPIIITGGHPRSTPRTQTTRMVKVECPECGYLVRTTKKWLDVATPCCPLGHGEMEVQG